MACSSCTMGEGPVRHTRPKKRPKKKVPPRRKEPEEIDVEEAEEEIDTFWDFGDSTGHIVRLSNGQCLGIIEENDGVWVALMNSDTGEMEKYLCRLSREGILIAPDVNYGDLCIATAGLDL